MPTFNRATAKAAGWTEKQIDDYLASPRAKIDAQRAAQPAPTTPSAGPPPIAAGGNPLAEPVGAAIQALGGLKSVGLPLSLAGGAYGIKKLFDAQRGGGTSLVKLTRADIAEHPEFQRFKPGQQISRSNYERVKMAIPELPPPVAAAAEATSTAAPREAVTQEMIDRYHTFRNFKPGETLPAGQIEQVMESSRPAYGPPQLSVVQGGAQAPASLEATVTPETMTQPAPAPSRHEIEYYNKGQKKFVPIESMSNQDLLAAKDELTARKPSMGKAPVTKTQLDAVNAEIATRVQGTPEVPGGHYLSESRGIVPVKEMHISHMRNAMNKAWARLQKNPTDPSLQRQFNDVKNEVTLRAQQAGELTVPSELPAVARNFRPSLGGTVGGLNEVAMILGMLQAPQQMAETDALMNQVRQEEAERRQVSPALIRALFGNQPQVY